MPPTFRASCGNCDCSPPAPPTDVGGPCTYRWYFVGCSFCLPTDWTGDSFGSGGHTAGDVTTGLTGNNFLPGATVEIRSYPAGVLLASQVSAADGSVIFHLPSNTFLTIDAYLLPRFGPNPDGPALFHTGFCAPGSAMIDQGNIGYVADGYICFGGVTISRNGISPWPASRTWGVEETTFGVSGTAVNTGSGWSVHLDRADYTHDFNTYHCGVDVTLNAGTGSGTACLSPTGGWSWSQSSGASAPTNPTGVTNTETWTNPDADGSGDFQVVFTQSASSSADPTPPNVNPCFPDPTAKWPGTTITWNEIQPSMMVGPPTEPAEGAPAMMAAPRRSPADVMAELKLLKTCPHFTRTDTPGCAWGRCTLGRGKDGLVCVDHCRACPDRPVAPGGAGETAI